MDMERRHDRLTVLPQCVPSRACFSCDVCCRFPEADSFLRPYFTAEEIREAVAHGLDRSLFPDPAGSQISLVPNQSGEGFLCPAFDLATAHCRIYEARPLDCQIYPLALMWSADRREVLLGWDTKCPYLRGAQQGLDAHADRIATLLEREETAETLARNPRLIGRFQDDVVVLRSLPGLTKRLADREASSARREEGLAPRDLRPSAPCPSRLTLHPLTLDDRPRFEEALALVDTPLAHYAFAPHFIWRGLLDYGWAELAGRLCLFAASPDGLFMPLPPLPQDAKHDASGVKREAGRIELSKGAYEAAFAYMRERNHGSAVSRIENVPEEWKATLEGWGYDVKPKSPDYLYRTEALARLAGDRYKSQRAACNRFARTHRFRYAPYRDEDRERCLALYGLWARQQEARSLEALDRPGRWMLQDSASAHAEALAHQQALGLIGRVVHLQDRTAAYTFGYAKSASVYCILLEVADRSVPGLAQFLFREVCREAEAQGYAYINTMDDSGLPGLAQSKQAYHPVSLVSSYVASEERRECA